MFHKSIKYLIPFFIGFTVQTNAQLLTSADQGLENLIDKEEFGIRTYKLGDIKTTGNVKFNELTIMTFTGLEKGQEINIPGEQISDAIRKLWKLEYFSDVTFYETSIVGDVINLELHLTELPRLNLITVNGLKKGKKEELLKELKLSKGAIINENLITTTKNYIVNKYRKDGYYNTIVKIETTPSGDGKTDNMVIDFDKGKKVRIDAITIEGNSQMSSKQLRKAMKDSKVRSPLNPLRIFKSSKFVQTKYDDDLVKLIDKYKENGYRDARILDETVKYNPKDNGVSIDIKLEEGRKYYIGNIRFIGNTVYQDQYLRRLFGIQKGEVYNGVLLQKRIADPTKPDAFDLTNLYQNNGYLFSNVFPVETKTYNDTIDFDIRIIEGPIARYNNITVSGNNKTHDNIIYRELQTRPGQVWNRGEVIETIRRLGGMGIFDAESIVPDVKNADAEYGTVDINWDITENGQSQIEVQGGYGGGTIIGTLALSFNNFSARNIFNKDAYKPFPMGDAQKTSLRLQASTYFQTYSISFSEPWFGGRKPISLFGSVSHSRQFLYNSRTYKTDRSQSLYITSVNVGIAKRLSVPDDFFTISHTLGFQYYDLNNYNSGLFTFSNGSSKNLSYTLDITRDNRGNNPIFPKYGSMISLNGKFSPPYSLFSKTDFGNLENEAAYKVRTTGPKTNPNTGADIPVGTYLNKEGLPVANFQDAAPDQEKIDQKRFNWLEYYKINVKAEWYTNIIGDLVLKTTGQFGFLGSYNKSRGQIPFERFYLGGSGMMNYSMDGRENVSLRGYADNTLSPRKDGYEIGGTVYNKFSLELRYPITLKQSMSAYVLTFFDAGAAYASFEEYSPFKLQRGAGAGVRVHMPMFGLLGIDFGWGFDNIPGTTTKGGFQTHFVLGQQF